MRQAQLVVMQPKTPLRRESHRSGLLRRPNERGRAAAPLYYPGASLRSRTGLAYRLALVGCFGCSASAVVGGHHGFRRGAGGLLKASPFFADLCIEPSVGD